MNASTFRILGPLACLKVGIYQYVEVPPSHETTASRNEVVQILRSILTQYSSLGLGRLR